MTPVRIKCIPSQYKIEVELIDLKASKLHFLSQGFSHKLNLTLTQKTLGQDWTLQCEGTLRLGIKTSPVFVTAQYKLHENQKFLEAFDFEAAKFKYKESYKKTTSNQYDYNKNGNVTLLKEITKQIYEPMALIWKMFQQGSNDPESFDGKEFDVLVGGKIKRLLLEKSGSGYLGTVNEKKIFSVHKSEQEKGVIVQILLLPFKPEIKIKLS